MGLKRCYNCNITKSISQYDKVQYKNKYVYRCICMKCINKSLKIEAIASLQFK